MVRRRCVGGFRWGANAWRRVEGVMADVKITRKLKGKVLMCVTPAYLYCLETVADVERENGKNWTSPLIKGREEEDGVGGVIMGTAFRMVMILGNHSLYSPNTSQWNPLCRCYVWS